MHRGFPEHWRIKTVRGTARCSRPVSACPRGEAATAECYKQDPWPVEHSCCQNALQHSPIGHGVALQALVTAAFTGLAFDLLEALLSCAIFRKDAP
jgi:hypothetical protein